MGDFEDLLLPHHRSEDLQSDREVDFAPIFGACVSYGQRESGELSEASVDGEDVSEIHLERIIDLLSKLPSHRGRGGGDDDIDLLVGLVEVLADELPHE